MNTTIYTINGYRMKKTTQIVNDYLDYVTNIYWLFGKSETEINVLTIVSYDDGTKTVNSSYGINEKISDSIITDSDINKYVSSLNFDEVYYYNRKYINNNIVDALAPKIVSDRNYYYDFYQNTDGNYQTDLILRTDLHIVRVAQIFTFEGIANAYVNDVKHEFKEYNSLDDLVKQVINKLLTDDVINEKLGI